MSTATTQSAFRLYFYNLNANDFELCRKLHCELKSSPLLVFF
jgi:hypothetical protein